MLTGELRNRVDQLWTEFWTGGITNPLSVIEQISFLMFARLLDITESRNESKARRTDKAFRRIFPETAAGQNLRWSRFKNFSGEKMLPHVRDKVFKHFREVAASSGSRLGSYMADAQLLIQKESLLVKAVNMIDALPLTQGDTKGDLYEYLLSKLTTAGINGQFRTPRHIIRLMVQLVDPKKDETICDPACGTGGFLVEAMRYVVEQNTSKDGVHEEQVNDHVEKIYTGDLLDTKDWKHLHGVMFHGFDFDGTMLRIAAMNLLLHGVEDPDIHYQDTLASGFADRFKKQSQNFFDVVLANPPFKGSLDYDDVESSLLAKVKTKKTELLFLVLMLRMLRIGGRAAVVVPDGVLFGSSNAHQALRKMICDENQLDGVISLPSGVFKPYAGVSTAILVFTKGGTTKDVFFYDVQADGFSLDDKRDKIADDDLPDVIKQWEKKSPKKLKDRTKKAFFVSVDEMRERKYDLSINRYKEVVHEEVEYEAPGVILDRLEKLEVEILEGIRELRGMIG